MACTRSTTLTFCKIYLTLSGILGIVFAAFLFYLGIAPLVAMVQTQQYGPAGIVVVVGALVMGIIMLVLSGLHLFRIYWLTVPALRHALAHAVCGILLSVTVFIILYGSALTIRSSLLASDNTGNFDATCNVCKSLLSSVLACDCPQTTPRAVEGTCIAAMEAFLKQWYSIVGSVYLAAQVITLIMAIHLLRHQPEYRICPTLALAKLDRAARRGQWEGSGPYDVEFQYELEYAVHSWDAYMQERQSAGYTGSIHPGPTKGAWALASSVDDLYYAPY